MCWQGRAPSYGCREGPSSFWGCLVFLGLWPHHSCLCFCIFFRYVFSFLTAPGLSCGAGSADSAAARGPQIPDQGPNPGPVRWEHRGSAAGPPGKSLCLCLYAASPLCISLMRTPVIGSRAQSKSRMISSRDPEASTWARTHRQGPYFHVKLHSAVLGGQEFSGDTVQPTAHTHGAKTDMGSLSEY